MKRLFRQGGRTGSQRDVSALIVDLERSDDSDAVFLAYSLGELRDPSAVEPLLNRMRRIDLSAPSPDNVNKVAWAVIAEALGGLATAGSPAADELVAALEHPVGDEYLDAMDALATMGEQRAVEPLLRRLRMLDLDPHAPWSADWESLTDALGRLRAQEAVDFFIDALGSPHLAEGAANALGQIRDPRAVPALAAALEGMPSDRVGEAILEALSRIGTTKASEVAAVWRARGITLEPDQL